MSFWGDIGNAIETSQTANNSSAFAHQNIFGAHTNSSRESLLEILENALGGDNHEDLQIPYKPVVRSFLYCIYALIICISLCGNGMVCFIVLRKKKMRTVTNFFLANQSLSDIVMTIFNAPFLLARNTINGWPFGEVMCHTVDYTMNVSVYVSTLTLVAIALDRHRVILHPLRPRMTMRSARYVVVVIWFAAVVLPIPMAIFRKLEYFGHLKALACIPDPPSWEFAKLFQVLTIVLQYCLPLGLITVAYVRIALRRLSHNHVGDYVSEQQQRHENQAKIRTIKMLVMVVVTFTICWLPINVYLLTFWLHPSFRHSSLAYVLCHWVAMSSACINPVIYCLKNGNFRSEFKAMFKCLKCKMSSASEQTDQNTNQQNTAEINIISTSNLNR
ncbi:G-protein coupled receptor 83-like [Ptychodera flava]|uniref:G-protein coupled receptor 83-like n=1 Tax=Ptychodera flava TaxID=63121 RepID=UPI00396A7236